MLRTLSARRVGRGLALLAALGVVGTVYALVSPAGHAQDAPDLSRGHQLYDESCITCHGRQLQGVANRGPSLIGVGEAAVYFQVSTGRMPATQQGADMDSHAPVFNVGQINDLAAYVQSAGGGPTIPDDLKGGEVGRGGELFRLNCASCHNFSGMGGALSSGKSAPQIRANDKQIYAAMLSGPGQMPVFNDTQITPEQKREIVNYIQTIKEENDPGGFNIGRSGPVPEGLVAWIIGIGGLLLAIVWMGAKS